MGVFSCLYKIPAFFFPGFRTFPGHVPKLPTIVSVSPKNFDIAFSCQGETLSGFILLFSRPLPPFPVKKHIQHGWQCLGPTIFAVYITFVHAYLQLGVSYFVQVLYQTDCQERFLCIFILSKVSYKAHVLPDWSVVLDMMIVAFLKCSK